jgi:hypothetical protein
MLSAVEPVPTLRFTQTARRLGAAAQAAGLTVPAFRCPPRLEGVARTVRRYPGGAVVSVRLQGRDFDDVAADMIDGVLVVNRVEGDAAAQLRPLLASAVESAGDEPAGERAAAA